MAKISMQARLLRFARNNGVVAGVALLAFIVYFRTLAPVVTGEDAGELAAAAYVLGVPHPPGYATWTMLAHGFTWLPWGTVAWRCALFSAVCGTLTCGVIARIVLRIGSGAIGAAAAGLALAFSDVFWSQSVIVEVYTLDALFIACVAALLLEWELRRDDRLLFAVGLLCGLGTGAHYTMFVVGTVAGMYVIARERFQIRRLWTYAGAGCLALLGACVHGYVYFAGVRQGLAEAAQHSALNWGDPSSLSRWLRVLSREQFAFMTTQTPHATGRFAQQLASMLGMGWAQFTPWAGVVAVMGVAWLVWRSRGTFRLAGTLALPYAALPFVGFLVAMGLGTLVFAAWVQNFSPTAEWREVMAVFAIPWYMVLAVGVGAAVGAVTRRSKIGGVALAAICVLSPLIANYHDNNQSQNYWAARHARAMLEALPQQAVLVPEADYETFPVLYLQIVEGVRRDVKILNKYGYVDMKEFRAMPDAARYGDFPLRRYEPELYAWYVAHHDWPVYFSEPPKWPADANIRMVQAGGLWRALRAKDAIPRGLPMPPPGDAPRLEDAGDDYTLRAMYLDGKMRQADWELGQGRREIAIAYVREAALAFGNDAAYCNLIGGWCARNGFTAEAKEFVLKGLRSPAFPGDPETAALRNNLDRLNAATP